MNKPSGPGELLPALQEPKIRDLKVVEPIKEALRYSMLLVGLRANNMPGEIEKVVLIKFISENYGGHTAAEIRLAFEMAVSGKLEIDDVNCYENFSAAYFGKIMNAYRRWSSQQYRQEVKEEFVQRIYTDEEMDNENRELTELFYQRIRNGVVLPVPDYARAILVKDGIIETPDDAEAYLVRKLNAGSRGIYEKKP